MAAKYMVKVCSSLNITELEHLFLPVNSTSMRVLFMFHGIFQVMCYVSVRRICQSSYHYMLFHLSDFIIQEKFVYVISHAVLSFHIIRVCFIQNVFPIVYKCFLVLHIAHDCFIRFVRVLSESPKIYIRVSYMIEIVLLSC